MYERYVIYLTNIAIKKTPYIETAKECVQDVFISLYHRKDELQTTSSLKAYLYTALQHKIYNQYHKELTRLKHESIATKNQAIADAGLSQQYESKIQVQQIEQKIQSLPPQCRKVFLMSREEQLTYKQIAEQLNISVNTVDQHIQRALRILRASLDKVVLIMVFIKVMLFD